MQTEPDRITLPPEQLTALRCYAVLFAIASSTLISWPEIFSVSSEHETNAARQDCSHERKFSHLNVRRNQPLWSLSADVGLILMCLLGYYISGQILE